MSRVANHRCPRCDVALREIDYQGIAVEFCSVCRGGLTSVESLPALLGHELEGAQLGEASLGDMDQCPACGAPVIRNVHPETTWVACAACDRAWLESLVMNRISRSRPPSASPPPRRAPNHRATAPSTAPVVIAPTDEIDQGSGAGPLAERLPYDLPLIQYLAVPIAALIGFFLGALGLARPIVFIVQIWFHEVGHAVPAWLSSRAALPLPFGFTFWREESSFFTGLCVLFLIGVLGVASFRERRYYGVAAAGVLVALWAYMTLVLSSYDSIGWILFGGLAGELVLSTVAIVSFYYRGPDRLRWDFWRYVVLIPAACVFASSFAMWVRIEQGTQALPLGSIIGAPGDGTGDIERMMAGYGWTGASLTQTYRTIGSLCLLAIVGHYAFFAIRARLAAD